VNLDAVAAQIAASLDRSSIGPTQESSTKRLVSGWRGPQKIDVECHHFRSGDGDAYDWHVVADLEASPPLILNLNRRGKADAEAAARGDIVVVPSGDAAFDEEWTIEGAPRATVPRVFSLRVREAVTKLAPRLVFHRSDAYDAEGVLHVAEGKVKASKQGPYDADLVLLAVDLVVAVCEEISALADARRGSPPSPEAVAAEEAEVRAVRANAPDSMEGRFWRRLSRRSRVLIVAGAVVVGIGVVIKWVDEARDFLPDVWRLLRHLHP
jgi:hypothetical protein